MQTPEASPEAYEGGGRWDAIISETVRSLESGYQAEDLFIFSKENPVFCAHVNGLTAMGLGELGYADQATRTARAIRDSRLFDAGTSLYHQEVDRSGNITKPQLNTCKNAIVGLALLSGGEVESAGELVDALYSSPLFNPNTGLFSREYNPTKQTINPTVITQTNLWLAMVLQRLGQKDKAREVFSRLVSRNFDESAGFFVSQDCNSNNNVRLGSYDPADDQVTLKQGNQSYFSDDQALAIIVSSMIGEQDWAVSLAERLLTSPLYDASDGMFVRNVDRGVVVPAKTSYKNGLCGIALGMAGRLDELGRLQEGLIAVLYDRESRLFDFSTTSKEVIPDNVILATLALKSPNFEGRILGSGRNK